ncbi:hypothetical protein ASG76_02300 [Nocardioides sp. Soil774]|nr:hypothetical protein ASG76_02300 [Nocardioides sp. Soil774]
MLIGGEKLWSEIDALAQWGSDVEAVHILHAYDDELFGRPADRLARFVRRNFSRLPVHLVGPVADDSPEETAAAIYSLAGADGTELLVNLTGGTRLMFAGGLQGLRRPHVTGLYQHLGVWHTLDAQGGAVRLSDVDPRASERFNVAELLKVTWADDEREVEVAPPAISTNVRAAARMCLDGSPWYSSFEALGRRVSSGARISYGHLFEQFVAAILREVGVAEDDVAVSVKLIDDGTAVQEVDVVVNSHGRLHVVDCKLITDAQVTVPLGVQIREAESTRRALGDGNGQLVLLRPNQRIDDAARSLAAALDVRVVDQRVLAERSLVDALTQLVQAPTPARAMPADGPIARPDLSSKPVLDLQRHFLDSGEPWVAYHLGGQTVLKCRFDPPGTQSSFERQLSLRFEGSVHVTSASVSTTGKSGHAVLRLKDVREFEHQLARISRQPW